MPNLMIKLMLFTATLLVVGCSEITQNRKDAPLQKQHLDWAKTPPLGWNSWDYFGTTINEQQVKAQANAMAEHLLPFGYDIFTVDIQWYEPNAKSHYYDPNATLAMDEYGRLQPAPNRFPSSDQGKGFKALGDFIHSKGLRFGIHVMRGIPKQAVKQNTPILGTDVRAKDIALIDSICPWNPDMYGVDATKPEGQAYYDSIFQMYADWGVDFIKVDDISRPYDEVQKAEIEAIRKAIDKTGRPIVLSLSPGATPVSAGPHVSEHANMWRITDDFWDRWGALSDMFERVHAWEPYRSPGAWPDADMLPIGLIDFGRKTRFSKDEQTSMMSLWSIARSPLIFGGDMTRMDELTLALLTNPEMLAVNQNSINNRQVSRENNLIVWTADVPNSKDKYVALFNAQNTDDNFKFSDADHVSPAISGRESAHDFSVSVKGGYKLVLHVMDGGEGEGWDHAAWVTPTLSGPQGSISLLDLDWEYADTGWDVVKINKTVENKPITLNGKEVEGIGVNAASTIIYNIPEGYETFDVKGVTTHTAPLLFGVTVTKEPKEEIPEFSHVSVNFSDIGIKGEALVRDLWAKKNIGKFKGSFGEDIPLHGAALYRISPVE